TRSYGDWSSDVCSSDLISDRTRTSLFLECRACWLMSRRSSRRGTCACIILPITTWAVATGREEKWSGRAMAWSLGASPTMAGYRSEEHTSELQSPYDLV